MKVLIQKSHHSALRDDGWSGAPGEAEWVGELCHEIDVLLAGSPIQAVWTDGDLGVVVGDNDTLIAARHPEFKVDYDAFMSLHYDADLYQSPSGDHVSGWFWDRAVDSLSGPRDDALGAIFYKKYTALSGVPMFHMERRNPNTFNYYAFRQTTVKTPGIIVEHGVGAPGAPDHDWLRDNLHQIAMTWVSTLYEFGGVALPPPPKPTNGDTIKKALAHLDAASALLKEVLP